MTGKIVLITPRTMAKRLGQELDSLARVELLRGMRRNGWTVEKLARECDSSPSAVAKWLSGKRRVPGRALIAVGAVGNQNARAA